jgi:antitoxin (DNA-binding transcriptional repressor) of toxin-antitoxin stability system
LHERIIGCGAVVGGVDRRRGHWAISFNSAALLQAFEAAKIDEWQIAPFDKVASGSYLRSMRSVGLKTLKNKLSEYVRLAAGGETVLVTDRDRVVAEIGPPGPARSPMLSDALLLDAFRQGWMTPPTSVGRGPPARKPVMTIDELLSNLQRDRADR